MEDRFRASVEVGAGHDDVDLWSLVEHFSAYVGSALRALPGSMQGPDFNLRDGDGSTLERSNLEELRAAAREHHLTPDGLSVHYRYLQVKAPGADARAIEKLAYETEIQLGPDIEVRIWSWFSNNRYRRAPMQIDLESKNKLLLDGLKAKIAAERDLFVPDLVAIGADLDSAGVRPVAVDHPVSDAEPRALKSKPRDWLAMTWRDHTAAFVVTVVGGLAVLGIAAWFGFGG